MKEIVIIDLQGYFIGVELGPDDETGVSEVYEQVEITPATETEPAEYEERLIGYRVAIPVPPGLYKPRFDFESWEAYNAPQEPTYDDEGRPVYPPKPDVTLWVEGLTQEEIDAIRNQPPPANPLEQLQAENAALKARLKEAETVATATSADLQAFMDYYFANGGV